MSKRLEIFLERIPVARLPSLALARSRVHDRAYEIDESYAFETRTNDDARDDAMTDARIEDIFASRERPQSYMNYIHPKRDIIYSLAPSSPPHPL